MMHFNPSFPGQGAGQCGQRAESLVEVFRLRAAVHPDKTAFIFLGEEGTEPESLTYAELDIRARAIAARLQQLAPAGARVLLMYEAGLEYVAALAGCLYAGMVAVPAYPPDPMRISRTLARLQAIVDDAQATALLGTSTGMAWASALLDRIAHIEFLVTTDDIDVRLAKRWTPTTIHRTTLAFLQYTSGSTGEPKGVMIRHGNVLQNLGQIEATIDVDDAVAALWLPAYHDMGLVGGILQCWYSGRLSVMLSPLAFFQRPLRWLKAIETYRATTTGAPDFAFNLCVRKINHQERRQLDLSSLRLVLSGAEPVRPQTIDQFVDAFDISGVRREIFCPTYGLAEATLMVSCSNVFTPPVVETFDANQMSQKRAVAVTSDDPAARRLVGCGRSVPEQEIAIVDPKSLDELESGAIGEIWVAGKNVATGYWNRPIESAATFAAHTSSGRGPFLRTGDAGFFHNGELFISGRLKDMIIFQGRNFYPQDIEQTAENCHEALQGRSGAAFCLEDHGRERIVIVHEVARPQRHDLADICQRVRAAVAEAHDLPVDCVVLVRAGTIPKTTSGKIQRSECRQRFAEGELDALHTWSAAPMAQAPANYVAPRSATEMLLARAWAEVLDLPRVGVFDHFLDLGGHSLLAARLINRLTAELNVQLSLAEILERPTIAALAELIDTRGAQQAQAGEQDFLDKLEAMTEEEAQALLSGKAAAARIPRAMPRPTVQPLPGQVDRAWPTSGRAAPSRSLDVPPVDPQR